MDPCDRLLDTLGVHVGHRRQSGRLDGLLKGLQARTTDDHADHAADWHIVLRDAMNVLGLSHVRHG
ncbi:MAG: hypothetical protein KGL42_03205 [Betaproteobacteria bacterium]|nr:hypothetical protein [Betaproteobacteria bacterium]